MEEHLQNYGNKIILLAGARQVGKTTLGHMLLEDNKKYQKIDLNWDVDQDQQKIKSGLQNIINAHQSHELSAQNTLTVIYFDELHKYKRWKSLLRGYQRDLPSDCRIIVTGSARMEAYKKGRESLKGISILYHVFPLTVAELVRNKPNKIGINNLSSKFFH